MGGGGVLTSGGGVRHFDAERAAWVIIMIRFCTSALRHRSDEKQKNGRPRQLATCGGAAPFSAMPLTDFDMLQ